MSYIIAPDVYDIFTDIVKATSLMSYNNETGICFLYGDPISICNQLAALKGSQKYPAICLITNVPFTVDRSSAYPFTGTFQFVIATLTEANKSESYRNNHTYNGTLKPIAANFIEQIEQSQKFNTLTNTLEYDYKENYNYGSGYIQDDLVKKLNGDVIDAIELTNLRLSIKKEYCINN